MKLKIAFTGLLLLFAFNAGAQPGGSGARGENIKAIKIGFITQRINLTPEEAQKFWPVYNQYESELDALRQDRREEVMNARQNFDTMSDAEVEEMVDGLVDLETKRAQIQVKYHNEFKKVLPIRKVALLYKAERDFRQRIVEILRQRQEGKGPGGPQGGHGPREPHPRETGPEPQPGR